MKRKAGWNPQGAQSRGFLGGDDGKGLFCISQDVGLFV